MIIDGGDSCPATAIRTYIYCAMNCSPATITLIIAKRYVLFRIINKKVLRMKILLKTDRDTQAKDPANS